MHIRRSPLAALLVAGLVAAGCTTQADPSPSQSPSPPASPSPSPSEAPSSPSPEPTTPVPGEWEAATVPGSRNTSSTVTIVPGGDGLVAIGFDGGFGSILWTSGDGGRTWTDITPADFASIGIVSVVEFEGRLIGVGRGDTINIEAEQAAVHVSDDGVSWRKVDTATRLVGQMIDVVATEDGLFAVGGVPGADAAGVWRSTDGETWERTGDDIEAAFMWAIAEGGPGLVAVGWRRAPDPSVAVWTSTDGDEWTLAPDPEGFELHEATDVVDLDGTLVMVGNAFMGGPGRIWTSTDGLDWTIATELDGAAARTLVATPFGLLAVGGTESMEGAAWLSIDGVTWEPFGEPLPGTYFTSAVATGETILFTGATQSGTLETGIEAFAGIWSTTLGN